MKKNIKIQGIGSRMIFVNACWSLGSFTDAPLQVRTSALLNIIMPMTIVSDHLRSLLNWYKKIKLTKRVDIENTVGQFRRDSTMNNDNYNE